jgi:hypothetical protein
MTRLERVALLALVLLGACFLKAKPGEVPDPRPDPIPVRVRNENFADMNVYAVVSGLSRRLGMVTGNSVATFSVPWNFATGQSIAITAVPIGGNGSATTGALNIGYNQMIDFRIAAVLHQSSVSVHEPDTP